MAATQRLLAVLAVLLCAGTASAHGGLLHPYSLFTDPERAHLPKYLVGSATGFKFYDANVSATYAPGPIPWEPTRNGPLKISGKVDVITYLDDGCLETSALFADLTFRTAANRVLGNKKVYGYGFTGSCATGVVDLYRGNLSQGATYLNLLWWRDGVTAANGTLFGTAPNIFAIRRPPAANALRSILLVTSGFPLACADVKFVKPDATWAAKKKSCKPNASAPVHHG